MKTKHESSADPFAFRGRAEVWFHLYTERVSGINGGRPWHVLKTRQDMPTGPGEWRERARGSYVKCCKERAQIKAKLR